MTSLDENTTDYYTRKEKTQRDDMYSDTISDDDMWDSVSTHDHTPSSDTHTNASTINNLYAHEPASQEPRPHLRHRIVRSTPPSAPPHQPTENLGYIAIRISKLDLYLLFTLMCSILITSGAIIYNFNMGIIIVATIFLFLTVERSKAQLCGILSRAHAVIERHLMPRAEQSTRTLARTPHFMNATAHRSPLNPGQLGDVHRLSPKIGRNRSIRIHASSPLSLIHI